MCDFFTLKLKNKIWGKNIIRSAQERCVSRMELNIYDMIRDFTEFLVISQRNQEKPKILNIFNVQDKHFYHTKNILAYFSWNEFRSDQNF